MTALGVMRIFGRRRVPCYLAGGGDDPLIHSRWFRPAKGVKETTDPDVLEHYLGDSGVGRAVLIPCSDPWVTCVARLRPSARRRSPASVSSPDVLDLFVDKAKFASLLERHQVPHPRTVTCALDEEIGSLTEQDLGRYFLKPRDSVRCCEVLGKKAFFSATSRQFSDRLHQMREAGCGAIMQEYIPGPPDSHYFIDGFIDRLGIARAVFARRRLRIFPPDFGNSTAMVSVEVDELSQAARDLLRLLAAVGYRGIFSAEFKRDQRDGVLKVLEVNTRPWHYVEFAALCGVDVCDLSYRDALEQDVQTVAGYRVGRRYAIPSLEFRALNVQLGRGEISALKCFLESARAITGGRPLDDPMPAVVSAVHLGKKAWSRWTTGDAAR
jgi:D-aspartate ligase